MENIADRVKNGFVVLVLSLMSLSAGYTYAASAMVPPINYVYDELGRVAGSYDSVGNSAQYSYDQVGNVLAIASKNSGSVAILDFTPKTAAVGETVTITGTGFSSTANQNNVSINGTAATVTGATANTLTITISAATTSGPVTVVSPSGSAVSNSNLTVTLPSASAPVITGFTPAIVAAGSTVTISGSGFLTKLINNKVTVNGYNLKVSAVSAASISVVIPLNVGSGKITVATPYGVAVSSNNLIIAPPSINSQDIIATAQIDIGGAAQPVSVTTANKIGVVLFNAPQYAYLTIDSLNFLASPFDSLVRYEVYKSDNTLWVSGFINADVIRWNDLSIHLPQIPKADLYAVYYEPVLASMTLSAMISLDANIKDTNITIDGTSLTSMTNQAGNSKRLLFNGVAGQNLGLGITNLTSTPTNLSYVTIYSPDNNSVYGSICDTWYNSGCSLNLTNLPATGTYSMLMMPYQSGSDNFNSTLSTDITGNIDVGSTKILNTSRSGQNGRLTFSGTAGDQLDLTMTNVVTGGAEYGFFGEATVYSPDGLVFKNANFFSGFDTSQHLPVLPVTGTYTIFFDPPFSSAMSMEIQLNQSVIVPLIVDGPTSSVNITQPGQTARLSFSGTAGQRLGLGITDLTLNPAGTSGIASVSVHTLDMSYSVSMDCSTYYTLIGGCSLAPIELPFTGIYIVEVAPTSYETGSFTATLSTEVTGNIVVGTASNLSLPRAGQNGRLTFSGTAGDQLGLTLSNVVITGSDYIGAISVYDPNGVVVAWGNFSNGITGAIDLSTLPMTGTYAVVIDPPYATSTNMQVLLTTDVNVPLIVDGAASNVSITQTGQKARLTFSATAGQSLGLGFTNVLFSPSTSTYTYVYIYHPEGMLLNVMYCDTSVVNAACDFNLHNLPVTGTYTATVIADQGGTGSFTATLSTELTGHLVAGTPSHLNITRAGQNESLTFNGAVDSSPSLTISSFVTNPVDQYVNFFIYQPSGYLFTVRTVMANDTLLLSNLPETGTYTLFVDPTTVATVNMDITLNP